MRIIAGNYKKRNLFSVPGQTARPTTDFLKESLFNIIGDCTGVSFLDLYAGSGSVGLEALSRGARKVVFVEFSQKSIITIIKNINILESKEFCRLVRKKVIPYLKKSEERFDIVFLDPPYDHGLVNKTIREIVQNQVAISGGRIIIEHSQKEKIDDEFRDMIIKEKATRHSMITILQSDY